MTKVKTILKRPKALKATYLSVAKIFENLKESRAKLKRMAQVLDDQSDGLHYQDSLEALVRLEAQADALAFVFQTPRSDLEKWVADMEAYYRRLEDHIE